MWSLYKRMKATSQPPSEFLRIAALDAAVTGIEDDWTGWWAGWQLDNAVDTFGTYVENKLMETDDKGKPLHKIEDFLIDPEKDGDNPQMIRRLLEQARYELASVSRRSTKRRG